MHLTWYKLEFVCLFDPNRYHSSSELTVPRDQEVRHRHQNVVKREACRRLEELYIDGRLAVRLFIDVVHSG